MFYRDLTSDKAVVKYYVKDGKILSSSREFLGKTPLKAGFAFTIDVTVTDKAISITVRSDDVTVVYEFPFTELREQLGLEPSALAVVKFGHYKSFLSYVSLVSGGDT